MKPKLIRLLLLSAALMFAATASAQGTQTSTPNAPQAQPSQPPPTVGSTVDREISTVEKLIIDAAEAMPEEKFNFTPETLKIPGDEFKDVRTFAIEVKHIATSNYFLWSPITGDKFPEGLTDGNGPAKLKSKAEIIKFLKDSFALGHKAAATLTTENMLQPVGGRKSPRLTWQPLPSPMRTITTDKWWSICA